MPRYLPLLQTFLRPLLTRTGLLLLLLLIGTGLRLLTPQLLATFIDELFLDSTLTRLGMLAGGYLLIALLIQAVSVLDSYLAANIGLIATNQLRSDLALHCLRLDMSFHNSRTPGELIERVDGDVGRLNHFFARFMVGLVGNFFLMLGIFFSLFWIDWRIGVAMVVYALVTFVVIYRTRNVAVPHYRKARQAQADLFGLLEERLAGTEDVRANGGTAYVLRRYTERARDVLRTDVRAGVIGTSVFSVQVLLLTLGTILALGSGVYLFTTGLATIGTVYLIYRYTELLREPIEQISREIQELQEAGASILRIQDLLSIRTALVDEGSTLLPDGPLEVSFEQVSFRYGGGHERDDGDEQDDGIAVNADARELVLDGVSFCLEAGKTLGLIGRTGSGKTTMTRLLFRLYDPEGGDVQLNEVPLPEIPLAEVRSKVAIVTQDVQLFHASVRNNLTLFGPGVEDGEMTRVLEQLGLGDWLRSLPDGLDTVLPPGSSGLSAGQAQLLAFARVLLRNPSVIVLDEASSRLDPATEQLLEQAVGNLLTNRTAIIIAHRLSTLERADYILLLEEGRIAEFGVRTELASDPNSQYAQLLKVGIEEALA